MQMKKKYQGIVVPVITPLTEQLALDHAAVEKIFDRIKKHGCAPFILGTTGEASSLPNAIRYDYIQKASSLKQHGEKLYAGIGSNCLQDSVELAGKCFDSGVDVVVATLPSCYSLTEGQMMKYFERLAERIPGPLMIYNIPSTTHMSIPLPVIDELSHHEKIVGVKDSERKEDRLKQSVQLWSQREDFSYFLGWAAKSAYALQNGADGLVPSTANFAPLLYENMLCAVEDNDEEGIYISQEQSDFLGHLYQSNRLLGDSLAALKALMKNIGLCRHWVMPPLEVMSPEEENKMMQQYDELSYGE